MCLAGTECVCLVRVGPEQELDVMKQEIRDVISRVKRIYVGISRFSTVLTYKEVCV